MPAFRIVALVPVRSLESGKSRLAEHLDAEERADLVARLLRRTIQAASPHVERVVVVSPDAEVLAVAAEAGAEPLLQAGTGLNDALRLGRERASALEANAVLVLPPDLVHVDEAEIGRIVAAVGGDGPVVVIVPDRHGAGTNALLLSPPDIVDFAFGPGSRQTHADRARRAGAVLVELDGPLALDIDTPEDLLIAEGEPARPDR
jgi:2-phospho-L-lactate guanylyltransferase